ncbi:ankyrin repeat, PH and SEC7 domain containing protein secG-like [Cotesia glomerata]|uniref:ankyrin repeat, PH and SEC7 domain containing protein secG-like n=1 Tax=Cotesia glomerata TaxID=32391 RepID=UPI001D009BA9|nr:ankyrin repeat, PH and SEC7 domain containing protein secG-like [Cotesia glomerata]
MTISYCGSHYLDIPENRLYSLGENPTLLHAAKVCHNVDMVERLINHRADIHYRTKSFKRTPLMLAIEENSPEIVDLLLKKGARIDERDENGILPLYYIICNPNNVNSRLNVEIVKRDGFSKVRILKSLMNAGANINETSESVGTKLKFLRMAITYGEEYIVSYLVDSFELDFMLVDEEILQTVILNTTLLSEEQLEDQEFMVQLKRLFMRIERYLMFGLLRRHWSALPVSSCC